MNQKTTIVLLIALVLAVGFVFAYRNDWLNLGEPSAEQTRKQGEQQKTDRARINKPLLENGPARENVARLEFDSPGQFPVVARLDGTQWVLESPSKMKADSAALEEWITVANDLMVAEVYRPGNAKMSAKSAGLSEPCPELILTDKAGRQTRLKIGKLDPLAENRTYVQVNDAPTIFAVDRDVLGSLTTDPAKLRSKSLWAASPDNVRHIAVASTKRAGFSLDQDRSAWTVTLPPRDQQPAIRAAADATKAAALAKSLCSLSAGQLLAPLTAEDLKLKGLDRPELTVTLVVSVPATQPAGAGVSTATSRPAESQPAEMTLTASFGPDLGGTRYGRIGSYFVQYFSLPTTALRDIEVAPADLRDKHIVPAAVDDVVGLTMVGLDGSLTELVKDDSQTWRMVKPATTRADSEVVNKLLRDATDLAVTTDNPFDDNPAATVVAPLTSPRLKLTFTRSGGKAPIVLRVGPKSPTAATTLVKIDQTPSIAWLPTADIDKLFVEPMALADKTVWSLNQDDIRQIARVESAAGGSGNRTVVRDGSSWKLAAPASMPADDNAVRSLLGKATVLKARQQTLLTAAQAKLDAPAVTLEFSVVEKLPAASQPAGGSAASQPDKSAREVIRVRKLALARKDDVTLYAQADGAGPVFLLDPSLYAEFTGELARRTLINAEEAARLADSATWLSIHSPAGVVELRKSGDEWKLQADATVKIDAGKVAGAIRDIAGVSVVRYVDFACKGPAALGLKEAPLRVEIGWPAGPVAPAASAPDTAAPALNKLTLLVYDKHEADGDYAMVQGSDKVGLVNAGEKLKLQKSWEDFQRTAAPAGPAGPPGAGPDAPFTPPGGPFRP